MLKTIGVWTLAAVLVVSTAPAAQRAAGDTELAEMLERVGRQVEAYYARARMVVSTERVLIQPLLHDLTPDGPGRRLVYELRFE